MYGVDTRLCWFENCKAIIIGVFFYLKSISTALSYLYSNTRRDRTPIRTSSIVICEDVNSLWRLMCQFDTHNIIAVTMVSNLLSRSLKKKHTHKMFFGSPNSRFYIWHLMQFWSKLVAFKGRRWWGGKSLLCLDNTSRIVILPSQKLFLQKVCKNPCPLFASG